MFVLAGIIAGILLSLQTAVNARLRNIVGSPFASALISCTVSFLIIVILLCIRALTGTLPPPDLSDTSWWMYLGGVFGVAVLIGCIMLFPALGAVQTTVLPIFGQILLGMLADTFGWFGSHTKRFSVFSLFGVVILIAGIVSVVLLPERKQADNKAPESIRDKRWMWQIVAVLLGMSSAAQAAVNGKLAGCLGSSLYASVSSIATVVVLTLLINAKQGTLKSLRFLKEGRSMFWAMPGGVCGVAFILLNTAAVPVIGTGTLMVLSVTGQIFFSVLIQHFGWFHSQQKHIQPIQTAGLLLMLGGVVMMKIL